MAGDAYHGAAASSTAHVAVIRAGVRALPGRAESSESRSAWAAKVFEDATR